MNKKQTVLVSGATGSIGGAAAAALANRGARVVLLGRKPEKLKARAERIKSELGQADKGKPDVEIETLVVDLSKRDSVIRSAAEALERFSRIDGLVLSVGVFIQNGPNLLSDGHELMFATNVIGPFLFTELIRERMEQSSGIVLHVIAPFYKKLNWDDLESIKNHKPMPAFNRTKTCNRIIAGELARRCAGRLTSVAFDPAYVIDKADPELSKRWPKGFAGFFWKIMTLLFAGHPSQAGEPIAELILNQKDRNELNGTLYKLYKRIEKPDKAMSDEETGKKLWEELVKKTGIQRN